MTACTLFALRRACVADKFDSTLRINKDDDFPGETVFYPFALQIRACLGIATRSLTFGVRNSIIAPCLGS
jgi:hypothetical protein